MKHLLMLLSILGFGFSSKTQVVPPVIDVIDYEIYMKVTDSTDRIEVDEWIRFKVLDPASNIVFDLVSQDKNGRGMRVEYIINSGDSVSFIHENDQLILKQFTSTVSTEIELKLHFSGIPVDGLIISKNKFGKRTFFGDNWPDRAHNWFACVDHPSDKATVGFQVLAPKNYSVVAVGKTLVDEIRGNEHYFFSRSSVPLPTKVMVVGIAELSQEMLLSESNITIVNSIYKGEDTEVFEDMKAAVEILDFFEGYIAPYEYEELENVQSTTKYGGMENAGCIFYDENAFNGRTTGEELLAHEIAHQWFGNSATESDWQHIWLSEGFATYFTNLYIRSSKGEDAFDRQLQKDRRKVIQFSQSYNHPVVDTMFSELEILLNAHSYQKGSWVLHMLRNYVGDSVFQNGIRQYYDLYRLSNATTGNLLDVFELESGQDLDWFFNQWLYDHGHPVLDLTIKRIKGQSIIRLEQLQQQHVFTFPLKILFTGKNGEKFVKEFSIDQRTEDFVLDVKVKITGYELDPETDLLFEHKKDGIRRKK